jgi:hypothetical protein
MTEPITSRDIIEDLVLDIEEERCVLLIGPEIIQIDGKSQTRYVHEQVLEQEADHIDYYYPNDSLFLFKDDADKNRVARRVKKLYRGMDLPLDVYHRILELPIPLVISLNPDTFLPDAAQRYGLAHHFSHFRFTGQATDEVGAPTAARPLFYNLCGCRTEEESLLLDYEDLFRLLRAVLPDGLPNKIRLKLREASSFLFLGFDFERWYTQLLLQLLTGERKGRPKFALRSRMDDGHAKNFLIHQFQIQFLGSEQHLFDSLRQGLAEEGRLRKLTPIVLDQTTTVATIRALIGAGNTGEALEQTHRLSMTPDQHNRLLQITARYKNWQRDKTLGLFQPGQAEPILNQIIKDLLDLLNELA